MSVSESADLSRLGLTAAHLNLVVAELSRAVIISGGIIAYGGRLRPGGFTDVIMNEVRRYGDGRHALEIYVPEPEYRDIPVDDLRNIDSRLGTSGSLKLVSSDGKVLAVSSLDAAEPSGLADAAALSAMRRSVSQLSNARILVGGKLSDFAGSEPGVIEEARLTLEASKPVYVAGGFGGAASAIAQALAFDNFEWAPKGFPYGAESFGVNDALERLRATFDAWTGSDGLTSHERRVLAISHRPGDIASLAVRGLARVA